MSKPRKVAKTFPARHPGAGRDPVAFDTLKLRDVCEKPQYGFTASASHEQSTCKFLRITDLQDTRVHWDTVPWCKATDDDVQRFGLSHGDVLVARIGATTGSTAIVVAPPKSVFASYLIRLRSTRDLNPYFLYFYTKGRQFLDWIAAHKDSNLKGGVNAPILLCAPINLPSKPEQQKIAAVLWKLQRAIATQDKLLKATADLKASAMQRLFTHGLRGEPLKDTEIGPMPEGWQILQLGQVAKLERGRFMHRPRNEPRFYGGNTPFVQTGDVVRSDGHIRRYSQSLNDDGVAISKVFPKDTILITIAANIGFTGILEFDSACPDSLIGISCMEHMDTEFLNFFLQTQQADMDRLAPKGTQKNINIQFLQPWPTKVPALDEQRAIASALAALDRKLAHHRTKRASLHDLFQTLLHQLMTGAIRVAALDIDVSEVSDHFPDARKMVGGHAARTSTDHLPDARKMTTRGKRRQH